LEIDILVGFVKSVVIDYPFYPELVCPPSDEFRLEGIKVGKITKLKTKK